MKQAGDPALEVSLNKSLGTFLLDVSFAVPCGITMLFGASGSGKTTILNCVAGLLEPDQGRIDMAGHTVFDRSKNLDVRVTDRNVGYVFQDLALFPHLSVERNIGYGIRNADRAAADRIQAMIAAFHLEHTRGRKPQSLSGGEQQRVALARALVTNPQALLLDEPLSALDSATKSQIIDDLRAYITGRPIPVLYVTHSREEVFALGQQVIALEHGRVVGQGTPREVLRGHRHEAIAEWGGVENIFEGMIVELHDHQGTMTFQTGGIELEVPLGRAQVGETVRIGVSANDVLLATEEPRGLSARNVIAGTVQLLQQRDAIVAVQVNCKGTRFEAHLTPGSVRSLRLTAGLPVWVVIKTHSCFLIQR
jgi:molybdate transport system ATP-binding protein